MPTLPQALSGQDSRFALAWKVLEEAIAERAFPGCSAAVTCHGKLVAWKALGRFTYEADAPEVRPETIFDLASVSKVVATTPAAMLLYERGLLDLEAPVASLLPEFADASDRRREQVTVHMLLAHSSGLPGWYGLYKEAHTREELVALAARTPLEAAPMARAEYSDIGFILLGEILSKLAEEPLDRFCQREVFGRLGMASTGYCPPQRLRAEIPPTQDDRALRQRVMQGEVNDENAWVMGGVAGHAGVFANACDIALFAEEMLRGSVPLVHRETLERFTRRETEPVGTSRALGWDTPSRPSQSGRYFSPGSFGHLGFTGTSVWCDPQRQLSITLLTNRTWPDRSSQTIKRVRPAFHDAVVTGLDGDPS